MASRDVLQRLGNRLRELRGEAGLTQEGLAERAGITWHFVSAIERGTKAATLDTLTAIAEALKISLSELFLDVDRPLPRNVRSVTAALAARDEDTQRAILDVVEAALALADRRQVVPRAVLRAAEPKKR